MIQEDYCSCEVSKLLRDKGFDEPCWLKYDSEGYLSFNHAGYINSEKPCDDFCALAPTHQLAMKWLREAHNIHIELNWDKGNQLYSFQIWKPGKYQPEISSLDLWRIYKDVNYLGEWNYEGAVEAALKYVLENLI